LRVSINYIILNFGRKPDKVGTETSHPDHQGLVLFWVPFGIEQLLGIYQVELDVLPGYM
jgi:hypothetical protein